MIIKKKDIKYINGYVECLKALLNVEVDNIIYNDTTKLNDSQNVNSLDYNVLDLSGNQSVTAVGIVTFIAHEMRCFYLKKAITNPSDTSFTKEEIEIINDEFYNRYDKNISIYNKKSNSREIEGFIEKDAAAFSMYAVFQYIKLIPHDYKPEYEEKLIDYMEKKLHVEYKDKLGEAVSKTHFNFKNTRIWVLRNSWAAVCVYS